MNLNLSMVELDDQKKFPAKRVMLKTLGEYMTKKMNSTKILIAIILLASFLIRVWHAPSLFFWDVDEDIVGMVAKKIIIDHRPQLIGFTIPGGLYIGPAFYYIISFFYATSLMNPLILPYFGALMGTITTFLTYIVAKKLFEDEKISVMASVIYGFSSLTIVYSRVFSGLSFVGISALLVYLFLYQNIKRSRPKNLVPLGLVIIFAMQNEGSSYSLLALAILAWLIFRFKVPKKRFLIMTLFFIILNIPLVIFNFRHTNVVAKSFLAFFSKADNSGTHLNISPVINALLFFPRTVGRILIPSGPLNINEQIYPCLTSYLSTLGPGFWLGLLVICYFICYFIFKKRKKVAAKIIALHFLIMVIGLLTYNVFMKGYIFEWTLLIFFPAVCIMFAYFLKNIFNMNPLGKLAVVIFISLFLYLNIKFTLNTTNNRDLFKKVEIVKSTIGVIHGSPYYLDSLGRCFNYGYLYLFWYFGNYPVYSFADSLVQSRTNYDSLPRPNLGVVIINGKDNLDEKLMIKYRDYLRRTNQIIIKDDTEVLILND